MTGAWSQRSAARTEASLGSSKTGISSGVSQTMESFGARGWLKRKNQRSLRRLRSILERGEGRGQRVTVAAG